MPNLFISACWEAYSLTFNDGYSSIKGKKIRKGITYSSVRRKRSHGGISIFHRLKASSLSGSFSPSLNWQIFALLSDIESNSEKEKPKKKTWNKNIKPYKKLILIQKYYEHENEYRPNNKGKFWFIISKLRKQKTGYKLVHSI